MGYRTPPGRSVVVTAGEGVQEVRLSVQAPSTVRFPGLEMNFFRQQGGPFVVGLEPEVYSRVMRKKVLSKLRSSRATRIQANGGHPAELASEIARNRQVLERTFRNQGSREVKVAPFYASEAPVTWRDWHRVMGTEHMPEAALRDPQVFLQQHGDLPATNIPKLACEMFRLREEERLRKVGALDDDHVLSLPNRNEMDYLIKGGLSLAEGSEMSRDPADREALREQRLSEQEQAWLLLERQATTAGRVIPARSGTPNRLGVYLGNVACWIRDGGTSDGALILGPSYRDRPSKPGFLVWPKGLMKHDLPQFQAYVMHDLAGFMPLRERYVSGDEEPGEDVGFYLVIRWRQESREALVQTPPGGSAALGRTVGVWGVPSLSSLSLEPGRGGGLIPMGPSLGGPPAAAR